MNSVVSIRPLLLQGATATIRGQPGYPDNRQPLCSQLNWLQWGTQQPTASLISLHKMSAFNMG